MAKVKEGLKCPNCKKRVGFAEQMTDWDEYYGTDCLIDPEFPAMINLFCENCEKPIAMVWIEAGGFEADEELQQIITDKIDKYEKDKKPN